MKTISRGKRALKNTFASFFDEIITTVCFFILPRLILDTFGSAYNGIIASIQQFISCIALMKAGIGGVTRSALYKPLADNDKEQISVILFQTERYMRRIAIIFLFAVFIFAAVYPIIINKDFDWYFSFSLILIIAISTFAEYYLGITNQMLLIADQSQYLISIVHAVTIIVNTIVSYILIKLDLSIHYVKFGSSIVFVLAPFFYYFYVKYHYQLTIPVLTNHDLIKQRWDAVGHELSNFINNNTDIIILTIFTNLKEVSVYAVYHSVIVGCRKLVTNFITGFGAAFGNMYANGELKKFNENFRLYELILFSITTIIYSLALIFITPFTAVYTSGITDVEYNRPLFGVVIVLASAFSCFRIPYETVVKSVGHYKQTRNGAILEAVINIIFSLLFVREYGLIGVAIGTLIASIYRTFMYAYYYDRNICKRTDFIFYKHLIVAIMLIGLQYYFCSFLLPIIDSWNILIIEGIKSFLFVILFSIIIYSVLYRNDMRLLVKKFDFILKL